jgi:hypothetical protein
VRIDKKLRLGPNGSLKLLPEDEEETNQQASSELATGKDCCGTGIENADIITLKQCFGSGSALDPHSVCSWIRIRKRENQPKRRRKF